MTLRVGVAFSVIQQIFFYTEEFDVSTPHIAVFMQDSLYRNPLKPKHTCSLITHTIR